MSPDGQSQTFAAALQNPWEAVAKLGITRDTTLPRIADLLMPHYVRVNGGDPNNEISLSRVDAAAHDLKERGLIDPWIARACETCQTVTP